MSKRKTSTKLVELTETHNIALSLKHMGVGTYDVQWKRALYHAVAIAGAGNNTLQKLREALELP